MADSKITVALALESSSFSKQLTAINRELKLNEAQFKQASTATRGFEQTAQGAQTKVNYLSTAIEQQGKKTALYKNEIGKTKDELDQLSKKHTESSTKINGMKTALGVLERAFGKNSQEVLKYKEKITEAEKNHEKINSQIISTSGKLTNLETNLAQSETAWNRYSQELNEAQSDLNNFNVNNAQQALSEFGNRMQSTGNRFIEVGGTISNVGQTLDDKIGAPLRRVGSESIKVGMDFEASMSNVKALSGATGAEFEQLKEKAKEMGSSTTKTAKESADAMGYMALAGWDTQQIMAGIGPVLKLSEASSMDLAKASDLVTDSMGGLGLTANDLAGYLDKVAKTQSITNTSAQQLLEGFLNVGATATSLDIPLNELSATLGILGNNGLKGKAAGTKLNAMLTRMTAQSGPAAEGWKKLGVEIFDNEGKFRGLEPVLNDTRVALGKFNQEQQQSILKAIMGTYNITPFRNLIESTGDTAKASGNSFRDFANDIENSNGSLDQMREIMQDNAQGSVAKFKSAMEGVGIKIAEVLLPAMTPLLETLTKALDAFGKLPKPVQEGVVKFGVFAAITPKVVKGVGDTTQSMGGLINSLGGLAQGLQSGEGLLGRIGKIFLRTAPAASTAAGGITQAATAATGMATAGGGMATVMGSLSSIGGLLVSAINPVTIGIAGAAAAGYVGYKAFRNYQDSVEETIPAVDLFADKIEEVPPKIDAATGVVLEHGKTISTAISDGTKQAVGAYMELDNEATKAMFNLHTNSTILTTDMKDKLIQSFSETAAKGKWASEDLKNGTIGDFREMLLGTATITTANKGIIIQQYTEMVNGMSNLTQQQKEKAILDFTEQVNTINALTDEQATALSEKYDAMARNLNGKLTERYTNERDMLQQHFIESNTLTDEQEKLLLEGLTNTYNERVMKTQNYEKEIKDIFAKASEEKRMLTEEERNRVGQLQSEMRDHAVNTLSEQESEAGLILTRMKDQQNRLTAETVSENIKKLNEQRDKSIKAAEEEYDKKVKTYNQMKRDVPPEQAAMFDDLIEEARLHKEDQIKNAEGIKTESVKKMREMGKEVLDQVNTDNGNLKTELNGFQQWWNGISFMPKWLKFKTEIDPNAKKAAAGGGAPAGRSLSGLTTAYENYSNEMQARLDNLDSTVKIPRVSDFKKLTSSVLPYGQTKASPSSGSSNSAVLQAIQSQTELLAKVIDILAAEKDVNVSLAVDGRNIAKATAKYMETELNTINRRKSRLGGMI